MTPQSAKAKGRKLQQHVRDRLLAFFNKELTPDDIRSTSMGASGEDLLLSQKARTVFPHAIECKNRRRIAVYRDYEQAEEHAEGTPWTPLVVLKENGKAPLVLVDLDYFIALCYDVNQYKECFLKQEQEISKKAHQEKKRESNV